MIRSQFISNLIKNNPNLKEEQTDEMIKEILALMNYVLVKGQRIEIRGFGSFSLRLRKQKKVRNPKTGQRIISQEKFVPYFRAGKELKDLVDNK